MKKALTYCEIMYSLILYSTFSYLTLHEGGWTADDDDDITNDDPAVVAEAAAIGNYYKMCGVPVFLLLAN